MVATGLELLFILLLLIVNGVFAMAEIAVVSVRKARLQQLAEEGDRRAQAALELANAPNRFLSTVQIGITLVGILAGAFGGATIAEELAASLRLIPALAPYSEAIGVGVVVLAITYLSLVIGELVPKRLGLSNAEGIARAVARPMQLLSRVATPAVALLSVSTDAVLRVLGVRLSAEPPVTEEEIRVLIAQGTQTGVFEAAEQAIVERVFRLADRRVGALMTPRLEMVALNIDDPPEENWRKMATSGHTHFPVYQDNLDNILGVVSAKDLWPGMAAGQPADLRALLRRPLFVPESTPALRALESFKQAGMDMALVLDEYGSVQGLVTLHDVLEALVGEVPSPGERAEPAAMRREDGSWLVDGMLPVDELKELLGVKELPGEGEGLYQTVAGFVMAQLGRIPTPGDHFEWDGWRFEVLDMDGHRVDKVLAAPVEAIPSDATRPTA